MKPAIMYVIRRSPHDGISVMEVTNAKARRYYGRNPFCETTNCAARDVILTLPLGTNVDAMIEKVKALEKTRREHNREIETIASNQRTNTEEWFKASIKDLLKQ